jgi:hypothetical protein
MMLKRGDTFLMGPEGKLHLHIIVTDPTPQQEVVLAPLTTIRPTTFEKFIKLDVGDHPFIKHPSAIACSFARIALLHHLQLLVDQRSVKLREPLTAEIVQRIAAGLLESDFTENGVKHLLREVLGY